MMGVDAAPVLALGEPPAKQATPAVSAGRHLGRLPEGFEASMSTVVGPENPSAPLLTPRDPPAAARPAPAVETRPALPTPLFTRHMLGAIEAERDRRRTSRATHRRLFPGRTAMAHPRLDAA